MGLILRELPAIVIGFYTANGGGNKYQIHLNQTGFWTQVCDAHSYSLILTLSAFHFLYNFVQQVWLVGLKKKRCFCFVFKQSWKDRLVDENMNKKRCVNCCFMQFVSQTCKHKKYVTLTVLVPQKNVLDSVSCTAKHIIQC